jgi:hypothetical protein
VQVRKVTYLVDELRAAVAALALVRTEHEVVEEELPATLDHVRKACGTVCALQDVVLLDQKPR